jgi:hypothetical protein
MQIPEAPESRVENITAALVYLMTHYARTGAASGCTAPGRMPPRTSRRSIERLARYWASRDLKSSPALAASRVDRRLRASMKPVMETGCQSPSSRSSASDARALA